MPTRSALSSLATLVLCAAAVTSDAAQIVDVRVGTHADYDRLVIEVDGELQAYHQPARSGERFVLELNARLDEPFKVLNTRFRRMGRVKIEAIAEGAVVQVQARPRQVRAFVLAEPTRVVVDFSNPEREPLPIPEGALALLEAVVPPWARVAPPTSDDEPVAQAEPGREPIPLPPMPEPIPAPVGKVGKTGPASDEPWNLGDRPLMLAVGAATLAGALAVVIGISRLRRPAPSAPILPHASSGSAETITPEELGRPGEDRIQALESRLDEEVRSRSRVEDRLLQLHEDMKVVRDRLHRLSRRGPGSGE